jgi:hypothetical protein
MMPPAGMFADRALESLRKSTVGGTGEPKIRRHREEQLVRDAERSGHLIAERLRDRLPAGPPDDLADDEPPRLRVITGLRAGLPGGLGVRDRGTDGPPVAQQIERGALRQRRYADAVGERVPYRRRFLAMGTELRPHICDPGVVVEHAPLGEYVHHGGDDALAGRHGVHGRVLLQWPASGVGAGDDVDDLFAIAEDRHLQSELGPGADKVVGGVLNLLLDVTHDSDPLPG